MTRPQPVGGKRDYLHRYVRRPAGRHVAQTQSCFIKYCDPVSHRHKADSLNNSPCHLGMYRTILLRGLLIPRYCSTECIYMYTYSILHTRHRSRYSRLEPPDTRLHSIHRDGQAEKVSWGLHMRGCLTLSATLILFACTVHGYITLGLTKPPAFLRHMCTRGF